MTCSMAAKATTTSTVAAAPTTCWAAPERTTTPRPKAMMSSLTPMPSRRRANKPHTARDCPPLPQIRGEGVKVLLQRFQHQDRLIVIGLLRPQVRLHRVGQAAHRLPRAAPALSQRPLDPFDSKKFTRRVLGFGHAIGIEHHHLPGRQDQAVLV